MKPGLVGLSSRGLRWQAPQVSLKICAGDLPASRFDWAPPGAAASTTATPMIHDTTRPTRNTMTPSVTAGAQPAVALARTLWPKKDMFVPRLCPPPISLGTLHRRCRGEETLFKFHVREGCRSCLTAARSVRTDAGRRQICRGRGEAKISTGGEAADGPVASGGT